MLSIVCALAIEVWRYQDEEFTELANAVKYPDYLHPHSFSVFYFASDISIYAIIPQFLFQGIAEALSLVTSKLILQIMWTHIAKLPNTITCIPMSGSCFEFMQASLNTHPALL